MIIQLKLQLMRVILNRNYFQYNGNYLKPIKDIAMGSHTHTHTHTHTHIYIYIYTKYS